VATLRASPIIAPYPSNATDQPPTFYDVSDAPGLQHNNYPRTVPGGPANQSQGGHTTSPMLPGVGEQFNRGTDDDLQRGTPPMRVPRSEPTREYAGVRFAANRDEMGFRLADQVYIPLPAIPKTTAISTRVRSGYPQFANDTLIPAVYVGGDALGGTNPQ
jgi:hypothetical protein